MNEELANFFKHGEYIPNIIFNSCLASYIVYEKDPISCIKNNQQLYGVPCELGSLCASRDYTEDKNVKYFNQLPTIKYLIAKNEEKKRIIVAFKGTNNIDDIIEDFKFYPKQNEIDQERIESALFKRAENVPIDYFLSKLMENYELIFTGHSLGAINAAMITIKILKMLNMKEAQAEDMYKKILFIGYGCPSVGEIYFRKEIAAHFKERFLFIKNKQDIVVEMFDYLAVFVYAQQTRSDAIANNVAIINSFLKDFLNILIRGLDHDKLSIICKDFSGLIRPFQNTNIPIYRRLGTFLQFNDKNNLEKVEQHAINKTEIESLFRNSDDMVKKVEFHLMKNYFDCIKMKLYSNQNGDLDFSAIETFNEFYDHNMEIEKIDFKKNENNTEIYLKVKINNSDHLVGAKLQIGSNEINAKEKDINGIYKFTCSNDVLFNKRKKIDANSLKLKLFGHFYKNPMEYEVDEKLISDDFREKFTQKYVQIQDMPFYLVYLHAALHIHLVIRMERNEEIPDNELIEGKNNLLSILDEIDELADLTPNKIDEVYEDELKQELKEYLEYQSLDYEQKNDDFRTINEKIKFDFEIRKSLVNHIKESENEENSAHELFKYLIPYVCELKKKLCRASNISEEIFEIIFKRHSNSRINGLKETTENKTKSILEKASGIIKQLTEAKPEVAKAVETGARVAAAGARVAVAVAGAAVAGATSGAAGAAGAAVAAVAVAGAAVAKAVETGSRVAVAGAAVAAVAAGAVAGGAVAGAAVAAGTALVGAAVAEAGAQGAVPGVTLAVAAAAAGPGAAVAAGAGAAVAVGAVVTLKETSKFLKKINFKNTLMNQNDDIMYKLILDCFFCDSTLFTGDIEKKFTNKFIDSEQLENQSDQKKLKIIQLHGKMRDILCSNVLIGVNGTKKSGKSTLVQLITKKNAGSSPIIPTTFASPYTLFKQVFLVDYAHFNSDTVSHKLEFYFTRMLLDHVILIFDAKMCAQTEDENLLLNLVQRENFRNFTIIYNQSDFLFQDNQKPNMAEFKSKLCKGLNAQHEDKVHLTYLGNDLDNLKKMDQMIESSVEFSDKLIERFEKILTDIIENYKNMDASMTITPIIRKKTKKVLIIHKGKELQLTLQPESNCVEKDDDETIVSSFAELKEEIKNSFKSLRNKSSEEFSIVSIMNAEHMQSIEGFLKHSYYCFKIQLL